MLTTHYPQVLQSLEDIGKNFSRTMITFPLNL